MRLLLASAALVTAVALAGCNTEGVDMAKAMKPLSPEMISLLEAKAMEKTAPILVRVFKEESELEVWKQDRDGRYALLKTYPICRWSGELGPKVKTGDRQAPEGFYTINPAQMNPRSQYYLSFNLGYPNAYDRAHGRTGAHLMVHGDCSSAGCYSMTDDQIQEIYSLGREAFFGGQKTFQVQAYPFRMTALNMAKHRNSPHLAFWKMLKEGNDHFEVARAEPKIDVCEKRYVFNAGEPTNMTPGRPFKFDPAGKCPAYEVPAEIAHEVAAKTRQDELAFADYVRRGTATVPVTMGQDGGMHPSFVAQLNPQHVRDARGNVRWVVESPPIGTRVRTASVSTDARFAPPVAASETASVPPSASLPASVPMPRPAPRRPTMVATTGSVGPASSGPYMAAAPSGPVNGPAAYSGSEPTGDFMRGVVHSTEDTLGRAANSVARIFGFGRSEASKAVAAKPAPAKRTRVARPAPAPAPSKKPEPAKPVVAEPAKPAASATPKQTADAAARRPANAASLMPGAAPVVPTGGFENRWPAGMR